jgi:hypothetical protein
MAVMGLKIGKDSTGSYDKKCRNNYLTPGANHMQAGSTLRWGHEG